MTSKYTFTISPRNAPEALLYLPPKEGVGNAGCPLHPRPRVHLVLVERTRVTTSTPESPDVPARNGFNGFLRALLGDRAVLPPSPTDMFLSKPGWADSNSANLTPASGRQDHTTSPYATTSLVRTLRDRSQVFRPALQSPRAQNAAASTASPSRVRDDRDTPLSVGRDSETHRDVSTDHGSEIFLQRGLDSPFNKPPDGQITTRRREHISLVSRTRCSALRAAPQGRDPYRRRVSK